MLRSIRSISLSSLGTVFFVCCCGFLSLLLGCGSGGGGSTGNPLTNPAGGTPRVYTHMVSFTAPLQPVSGTPYIVNTHMNGLGQGTYDTTPAGYSGTFAWSYGENPDPTNTFEVGTLTLSSINPTATGTTAAAQVLSSTGTATFTLNWSPSYAGGTISGGGTSGLFYAQ